MSGDRWASNVSVVQRRKEAQERIKRLRKKNKKIHPVEIKGQYITTTFWGKAWCKHLESFSDYSNRLPRGKSYLRNGAVVHLEIRKGEIFAKVSGTDLYTVLISIKTLSSRKWKQVKSRCSGQVGSVLELLQGNLSKNVMAVVTDRQDGLFPLHNEIELDCTCPDWAIMCKHVAAVMYGVGARLDENPELLFLLRGVDHKELIETQADLLGGTQTGKSGRKRIALEDLADVFGVEVSTENLPGVAKNKHEPKQNIKTARKAKSASGGIHVPSPRNSKTARSSIPPCDQEQRLFEAFKKAMARKESENSDPGFPKFKHQTIDSPTGREICEFRKRMGMTQAQLACLFGVTPAAVCSWEKKVNTPALQPKKLPLWKIIKNLHTTEI